MPSRPATGTPTSGRSPRAGPGPMDGNSILWMYHLHVDEVRDTNTGLIGPLIITRRTRRRVAPYCTAPRERPPVS
jgi:hypothetical protein